MTIQELQQRQKWLLHHKIDAEIERVNALAPHKDAQTAMFNKQDL